MPGCESILAVTASRLISVWFLLMWYQMVKALCMVVFRDEETSESTAAVLSREREREQDQFLDVGGHLILPY